MKPTIPKGTRDFDSVDIQKREFVIQKIKKKFISFGFKALETPSFENLNTLTGKYGEEGDRLIFKILNSSLHESKKKDQLSLDFEKMLEGPFLTENLTERALRYDLTVPFARFVAMNHGKLYFPYKRFQIQNVWRADRPQKGRFREFLQCDADIVGSKSNLYDIECIQLYDAVFTDLKLPTEIHFNHRKILSGIAEVAGIANQLIDFTVALDKLDKIGKDKVIEELKFKNIPDKSIEILSPLLQINTDFYTQIELLENILKHSTIGQKGLDEVKSIYQKVNEIGLYNSELVFNITLARGLDYYTGSIFEVKAKGVSIGSVGGGGRYDNLTEVFGVKDIPGIGISFGLDRIILAMEDLNLFKDKTIVKPGLLFFNLSEEDVLPIQLLLKNLRSNNIHCELYPELSKLKKQFLYAEKKAFEYVAFYGKEERNKNSIQIKNIKTGEQQLYKVDEISSIFK